MFWVNSAVTKQLVLVVHYICIPVSCILSRKCFEQTFLLNSDFLPSVRRRCAFGEQCQGGEQGRAKKCYHRVKAEDAYLCIGLWPSAIMRPISSIWHGQAKLLGYVVFCAAPHLHTTASYFHCIVTQCYSSLVFSLNFLFFYAVLFKL